MTRIILPRNNFFDGQEVSETDLDIEQTAWHDTVASNADFMIGSGVEQEFAVQRVLFDSDNIPDSIQTLIDTENFDGEPIFEYDLFDLRIFSQPSDMTDGNQLEVKISDSDLSGANSLKIYLFGQIFGGTFVYEVLTFVQNESQTTKQYFTKILAIMTQDFKGNQNTIVDGIQCRDSSGSLKIMEALPMTVVRDYIMVEQITEPNLDFSNFKSANMSETLEDLLEEIAAVESLAVVDLNIIRVATRTRELPPNDSVGLIIGQKFKATTNNIQKVSLLLSVRENTLALPGHEFDWSGDIVVGVRKLQVTTQCPTDIVPGTSIGFDPEPSSMAEVSFSKAEFGELGIILTDVPQVVDFVFTQSLIANPSVAPDIEVGQYYMITVRRSGNTSDGTIILPEADNTTIDENIQDTMRLSIFSQNKWTDVPESDMWFRVFTSAIRIVDGTAIDNGVQVTSPKIKKDDITGLNKPYVEGKLSLLDISLSTENYIIIQKSNNFITPIPHPATGNLISTRIEDLLDISVINEAALTTLIEANNKTVILGSVRDTNPINNPLIVGITEYPGLVDQTTFTLIQPASDVLLNNLVGSILTPNTGELGYKYRIIKVDVYDDAYGDVLLDGEIDLNDVARAQLLDGYSKDLMSGTLPSIDQYSAIINGTVTMEEILRSDVTDDGIINIYDSQAIQNHISFGTAFGAGSSFKRVVITVENIINPLTTSVDMISTDSSFNNVPFSPIEYQIDFVPLWKPENVIITDLRRFVPKTFLELTIENITGEIKTGGKNTSFVPGDLLLGGEILNLDGTSYSIDFETATIIIDLPEGSTQGEIDIFSNFIKDRLKFADGTLVLTGALESKQVWVTASIQSFVKDFPTGYDFASIDGFPAIKETIAILYTQGSGVLRIRANNIRNIVTRPELRTKIALTVYLKKAGFQNTETNVSESTLTDLLTAM